MASLHFFYFLSLSLVPAALGSFSVELIDRDSPNSPLYDPSATSLDHWRMAAERSQDRTRHFASSHGISTFASIVSPVTPSGGGYLMKLSVGTPPFDIYVIADTGSDLIWTNCIPCRDCYQHKYPLFDPAKSTTYSNIRYSSKLCSALPKHEDDDANNCQYHYDYLGGTTIIGLLAKENFTFNSKSSAPISIAGTIFGCTHKREGHVDSRIGGIMGLGAGELSLVSQLGGSIDNQFSYCLLPRTMFDKSSKFIFGPDDHAPRKKYKTPLIKNMEWGTHYSVTLVKITVGKTTIPVPGASSSFSSGNIVIDSGTTLTILVKSVVDKVVTEVKKVVKLPLMTDPEYRLFSACFATNGTNPKDLKLPKISFAFAGANVPLSSQNMFIWFGKNILCLALSSDDRSSDVQIYGSIAQQDFYVAYDLRKWQLSFSPVDCKQF